MTAAREFHPVASIFPLMGEAELTTRDETM